MQRKKNYALAYKDLDKIARPIVVMFLLFLVTTYMVCLIAYEEFLDSLKTGICLNILLTPFYYYCFGDEEEWKLKKY